MLHLEPESDLAVRDAVDAHLAGEPLCRLEGDASFATRNGAYRLRNGALVEARDPALLGAELVGWLFESPGDATVEPTFLPGARAVLVDRERRRQIIVTSACAHFDARAGSQAPQCAGSPASQPPPPKRTVPPPLPRAAIRGATPLPAPPPLPPRALQASRASFPPAPASRPAPPVHRPPRRLDAPPSAPPVTLASARLAAPRVVPPAPTSAEPFPLARPIPRLPPPLPVASRA
jgi:hypothetical protein